MVERLVADLVGPLKPDEVLIDRPADRYLTGILFPQRSLVAPEEDEQLGVEEDDEGAAPPAAQSSPLSTTMRPSSAGLSFALSSAASTPHVVFHVRVGTYKAFWLDESGNERTDGKKGERRSERWRRSPWEVRLDDVDLTPGERWVFVDQEKLPGLKLYIRATASEGTTPALVTAALVNMNESGQDSNRISDEERTFFQVELMVEPAGETRLVARPSRRSDPDEDGRAAALIYRDAHEYATGHTCAASWEVAGEHITRVRTTWIPQAVVPATSPDGDSAFDALRSHATLKPLSASWISEAAPEQLSEALSLLPTAYEGWLDAQAKRIPSLEPPALQDQAKKHIKECRRALGRMRASIELIGTADDVRIAFQLANRAMLIQRRWGKGDPAQELLWRPFQLGFQLLTLESLASRDHADRQTMDLLWFPTGGGKTEAYLALTAFILILRRLRSPEEGAGVGVVMRYTLRLLTIQQFQRAAAMICACELFHRGKQLPKGMPKLDLGKAPFSIGLWVGGGATPNAVDEAHARLEANDDPTPKQLLQCPACKGELKWQRQLKPVKHISVVCTSSTCELAGRQLPVWTVDEDIYRERPSLLLGTVDKFAQLPRKPGIGVLFGLDKANDPPDLIIQDELHLISGPLGTVTGLYEIAVDRLCSDRGSPPKIVGSTATIRRAQEQIRSLFDRKAFQFPPPVIDASNSCFALRDDTLPGRLYVGVTTAGRSPKFTLQAASASLLQSPVDPRIPAEQADHHWTMVAYFNSLRELGGALVLMQDDVMMSIQEYANRRKEEARRIGAPAELTSRKTSSEIPEILRALELQRGAEGAYDVLLASNMISVGVDVPRLGLMLVNGQPKTTAEYIQATSRVGREKPGLVVSVYNNGKARDRSHFETFSTWHRTLYRDVEATSVTPFASRAQDRALHAVLVILARHLVASLRDFPNLTAKNLKDLDKAIECIEKRAESTDGDELQGVRRKLEELITEWSGREGLQVYWDDYGRQKTLLMSAEQCAAVEAAHGDAPDAWPTPNSMREVEPGTAFKLLNFLRTESSDGA